MMSGEVVHVGLGHVHVRNRSKRVELGSPQNPKYWISEPPFYSHTQGINLLPILQWNAVISGSGVSREGNPRAKLQMCDLVKLLNCSNIYPNQDYECHMLCFLAK